MRLIWRAIYLLPIIALTTVLVTGEKQATASIRGQVYADRLGMLFSEVQIELTSEGKVVTRAVSDEQGSYKFGGLLPGRYTVIGFLPGTRLRKINIELKAGEQLLLDIGLQLGSLGGLPPRPVIFTGTVKLPDNTPVQDATVTVVSALDQQIIAKGITDAAGRYSMPIDYGNQLIILASKPGFAVSTTTLMLRGKQTTDELTHNFVLNRLRVP